LGSINLVVDADILAVALPGKANDVAGPRCTTWAAKPLSSFSDGLMPVEPDVEQSAGAAPSCGSLNPALIGWRTYP
jgi:hypothetical protein